MLEYGHVDDNVERGMAGGKRIFGIQLINLIVSGSSGRGDHERGKGPSPSDVHTPRICVLKRVCRSQASYRNAHPATRSVTTVISGGTSRRSGSPNVHSPRFPYKEADGRGHGSISSPVVFRSGPNGRRYRPIVNGMTRLDGLHWRCPSVNCI